MTELNHLNKFYEFARIIYLNDYLENKHKFFFFPLLWHFKLRPQYKSTEKINRINYIYDILISLIYYNFLLKFSKF